MLRALLFVRAIGIFGALLGNGDVEKGWKNYMSHFAFD